MTVVVFPPRFPVVGRYNTSKTERGEEGFSESEVQTGCANTAAMELTTIKTVIVHIKTQPGHILIIITDNL